MANKRTGQDYLDLKAGMDAIKRKKKGKHTNKSTDEFIEELKKRGEW